MPREIEYGRLTERQKLVFFALFRVSCSSDLTLIRISPETSISSIYLSRSLAPPSLLLSCHSRTFRRTAAAKVLLHMRKVYKRVHSLAHTRVHTHTDAGHDNSRRRDLTSRLLFSHNI